MTQELIEMLYDIRNLIEGYVDVNDGDDGLPVPNKAMRAQQMIDEAITLAEKELLGQSGNAASGPAGVVASDDVNRQSIGRPQIKFAAASAAPEVEVLAGSSAINPSQHSESSVGEADTISGTHQPSKPVDVGSTPTSRSNPYYTEMDRLADAVMQDHFERRSECE